MNAPAPFGRFRRTRGHAAITAAATPEIRHIRAAMLAETERQRELESAAAAVERARVALAAKEAHVPEQAALDEAVARLKTIEGAKYPSVNDPAPVAGRTTKR